jgi:imidazolonepropionase-like amidohydrolase
MMGVELKTCAIALAMLLIVAASTLVAHNDGGAYLDHQSLSTGSQIAIRCGRLIDGNGGQAVSGAVILIEGDRIIAAGPNVKVPPTARVIDLSRATVLPGLIDTHTHLTYHYDTEPNEKPTVTAIYAAENARLTLEAGFTSVRNLGAGGGLDFDLRRAIERGAVPGPRMVASGASLSRSSGETNSGMTAGSIEADLTRVRQFVRAQMDAGADVIKVFVTPGAGGGDRLLYSEDEVRAVVAEAATKNLRVAAHAHATEGIKAAVRAGVASLEHGSRLDDEAIRLMIEHHTALVPTLYLPNHYLAHRDRFKFDESRWQALSELKSRMLDNFKKARAAGVWIVMGSDAVAGLHGENARELEWMVKGGMTPAQAIRAATSDAASLLGWRDKVGAIEPGRFADIIATEGDPLRDITELQRVQFVMRGGRIFKDQLGRQLSSK